jgi:uncharacterized protein
MDPDRLREFLAGSPRDALAAVRAGALHGLVEAQTMLGQMLLDGMFVPADAKAALRWFESAAGGRHPEAMNMAGRCHELGWGTNVAPELAAAWYRKAATMGYAWGQYNLANLLLRGQGVAQDRRQALCWYQKAAAQGHAKSMNLIGRFHDEGWDVPVDRRTAWDWYRRSAEGGDFRGQYNYAGGLMAAGQVSAACQWLRRAISAGTPDFLAMVGKTLMQEGNHSLRELGETALARCASTANQNASLPVHHHG